MPARLTGRCWVAGSIYTCTCVRCKCRPAGSHKQVPLVIIGALSGTESTQLPILGEVRNWQLAFIVVGAPGVLLTLIMMLTVKEPARRGVAAPVQSDTNAGQLRLFLRDNGATVFFIVTAFSLGGIAVVGYLAWVPEFLRRSFGWNMAEIGLIFGSLMAIVGTAGTLFGGWFVDRLAHSGYRDAPVRASIIAFAFLVPAAIAAPMMPTAESALIVLGVFLFFVGMQQGYSPVALQFIFSLHKSLRSDLGRRLLRWSPTMSLLMTPRSHYR